MIVTRAPLRISFAGGGTDIPWYYEREGGAVVGSAINKYVWMCVNKKFDRRVRVSYSKTENVSATADLKHELAKACLRAYGIHRGIEIVSIADVPGEGTGLGSSSAYIVGLLLALAAYKGDDFPPPNDLAESAAEIELGVLKRPIGKQDHYFAAHGGLLRIDFWRSGTVRARALNMSTDAINDLEDSLLLLYTGLCRPAHSILTRMRVAAIEKERPWHMLKQIKGLADEVTTSMEAGDIDELGVLMYEDWIRKKQLATGITNAVIEEKIKAAIEAGAQGGKLLGAGGGGFLLVQANPKKHDHIVGKTKLRRMTVRLNAPGAEVIFCE